MVYHTDKKFNKIVWVHNLKVGFKVLFFISKFEKIWAFL